ncbi:MAG: penicillin-binding transpeptidase domain-containing protein [Lachnospiraceae bacterium]|nr:penicillin-binding transpeptidase domain-containing protein [Lachnospiraceae bacterium]
MEGGGKENKRRIVVCSLILVLIGVLCFFFVVRWTGRKKTESLLRDYMDAVSEQKYDEMYHMIDTKNLKNMTKEEFKQRNSNIYEGMEAENFNLEIVEKKNGGKVIRYQCSFDTVAGKVSFEHEAHFVLWKDGWKLVWDDGMIYPNLGAEDKIRIKTTKAERGRILDRSGQRLAGSGCASSVGIVPGKLKDKEKAISQISQLLEVKEKTIEDKLSAKWVKEDSFVPIKTIPKLTEAAVSDQSRNREFKEEQKRQKELLTIPGVMISDTQVREYPLGEAASHLIGYVQKVTAEDLEEHKGEDYDVNSQIGKSGIESLYEKGLKGTDGHEIYILDQSGKRKETIVEKSVQNGKDIQLTIDSNLQRELYRQFQKDKSCSVAMNPYTGEVLAMISTPSFDNNDFIFGMSDRLWNSLNKDKKKPLYNRFRQIWCPGSTFKPMTSAIGLTYGAIDPQKDYGSEGTSWQKDASWGEYRVTTLHTYQPVNLKNALIYSDNIYFAKAALRIGADDFVRSLQSLGFDEEIPFEIKMKNSQYSNNGTIESEIQLADSGYGQGQILINPLHLASLYTLFCNQGNVIQPSLIYQEEKEASVWIEEAFSDEMTEEVLSGLDAVVNDPHGTGYAAHRTDIRLAGKTGTAEIKASKTDTSGTELGWFAVFTKDKAVETPVLLVSMVEDVKNIGGSGYVVRKDKAVLDAYLKMK